MIYFLDTNICNYGLKGKYPEIPRHLARLGPASVKIPAIVKGELLCGAAKSGNPSKALNVVNQFLLPFEIIPFDDAATELYARIRVALESKGSPIGPNDLIIAAIVMSRHGVLITHNVREFGKVDGLKLKDWVKS